MNNTEQKNIKKDTYITDIEFTGDKSIKELLKEFLTSKAKTNWPSEDYAVK